MADVDIEKKLTTNHAYGISALVLVMCWCIYPFEASSLGKSGNLFLIFVIGVVLHSLIFSKKYNYQSS